jgi:hypothetical protein
VCMVIMLSMTMREGVVQGALCSDWIAVDLHFFLNASLSLLAQSLLLHINFYSMWMVCWIHKSYVHCISI